MVLGKIIGVVFGSMVAGPIGAIIGLIVGHYFDKGLRGLDTNPPQAQRNLAQETFFETTFLLLGHLAKADGRISEEEVAQTEVIMGQMGLTPQHRGEAIALFKRGSSADFVLDDAMIHFMSQCGRYPRLQQTLLEYVCHLAFGDGELLDSERQVLANIARWLGLTGRRFDRLMAMFSAQYGFSQAGGERAGRNDLELAYQALGIDSSVSDREVKRAYRKLISEHHPDKLIAQGVPEDMIKLATEKSQEIRGAYDKIKQKRGFK
ncbi:MAG: co-chaperone DjlA [Pseudomonadales bacterium]